MSDANFLIAAARITTEKGAAIDSFYLTDLEGEKVTSSVALRVVLNRDNPRGGDTGKVSDSCGC